MTIEFQGHFGHCLRMEEKQDRAGGRLADMLGGLRKPVTNLAPESHLPMGEKATERPEDAQEAARGFKGLREGLGLSILDASAFLRVPPRTLYAWEDGTMQINPTAWILLQILTKYPTVRKWVTPAGPPPKRGRKR